MKTNLIYFIYVKRINDYHYLNLELLKKYAKIFNGDIVVKIAANCLQSNVNTLAKLIPFKIEIVRNNQFGEALHFANSLKKVEDGITFYAHCKGVTRHKTEGLTEWIKYMYKMNLETLPDLTDKIFSGTLAKLYPCDPHVPEPFHYAGSFYWFDTNKVKERLEGNKEVTPLKIGKYFTERLPALIADKSECEFRGLKFKKEVNLYESEIWDKINFKNAFMQSKG